MKRPLTPEKLENFVVVLVQPLGAGNVGSIARTMSHFGLSNLRIVSPRCDLKSVEARSMAMIGQPLLASAAHYPTLREALQDCSWAIATSRRLGRNRTPTLYPREGAPSLLQRAEAGSVALVFGREDKGLRTDEVDLCQEQLLIPAMPGAGSFNLSQAVLLVLWELFMHRQSEAGRDGFFERIYPGDEPASRDQVEGLVDHLVGTLEMIGFVPRHHPEKVARSFRDLVDRIHPSDKEVRMLRGVLRQVAWKISNRLSSSEQDTPALEDSPMLEEKRNERLIRNS